MSKSSQSSKESSSKKIDKVVMDAEERKLKYDKLNKVEGSKAYTGSSARASLVGRTLDSKMQKLKKSQDPAYDYDSNADEG